MSSKRALRRYNAKRDFAVTPEPRDGEERKSGALAFVVQKHWARRLHYDFRLEIDGAMKSWAVPKGPSLDPSVKRMAVHVEDHPLAYNDFEGTIPAKQYGAGRVIIWDRGVWRPLEDAAKGYRAGKLKFELLGQKLRGRWALVRIRRRADSQDPWLLIKEKDEYARSAAEFEVVEEARKRALPRTLSPVLATLVDQPPFDSEKWIYEIKFDGYRILARKDAQGVRLFTRNGHDWTSRLKAIAASLQSMKLARGWFDGEIVALDESGQMSFQKLQNAFETGRTTELVYFLFDLPFYDGYDYTSSPLIERRALLQTVLASAPASIRFSDTFKVAPDQLLESACKLGLEGIIGKRKDSRYLSRRTPDWIKLKCGKRQTFVVGGWTDPKGSRSGFGALLLGNFEAAGSLKYVGKVGTGFSDQALVDIHGRLRALASDRRPFSRSTGFDREAHWVKPELHVEVTFAEWTQDRHLRHPAFQVLRESSVTHPERVIDRSIGAVKLDVVRYYGRVGKLMMGHLKGRPVSLARAPNGVDDKIFFQKHWEGPSLKGVRQLDRSLDPDHPPLIEIASPIGLSSAAQMNVIEFHTWNGVHAKLDKPDRITFDLDPGKDVTWASVRQAAELLHAFLAELGLPTFLKTSGGKGLHVVIPIRRNHDWEIVKNFSKVIAQHLAHTLPDHFVAKSGPRNRIGRIFIDYLRNGRGATTVSAWSLRARPGLGISVPISWRDLAKVSGGAHWTLQNIESRLAVGNNPWKQYGTSAKSITAAMQRMGSPKASRNKTTKARA